MIRSTAALLFCLRAGVGPWFVRSAFKWKSYSRRKGTKAIKNRVHLDLTTGADDRDAEIERLLRLGARRVNIGQTGDESWTVLADPEGNEFCVVRPKSTLIE
jgi:hypothetical protein